MSTTNRVRNFLRERLDVEMFQKGWWMLLLIMGTIGVLFVICCIMVFGHQAG